MAKPMWCCGVFKAHYEGWGHRGFSVHGKGTGIFLKCRSIAKCRDNEVEKLRSPFPLSLVTEVGIVFCPWCGTDLLNHYGKKIHLIREPEGLPEPNDQVWD